MAVSTAPAIIPRTGLEKAVNIPVKPALLERPDTESDMVSIPNIRIAKPRRIFPKSFFLDSPLLAMVKIIPIAASTGENELGFSSCINIELPCMPVSDKSHDVTVVPILAPIMIPTA